MNTTPIIDHELISQRAHRIWELAGKPDGRDEELWLQAELELRLATVQSQGVNQAIKASASPARSLDHAPAKAPHSTAYAPTGVTTDALHHRRSK